jgi:hypothetical protein
MLALLTGCGSFSVLQQADIDVEIQPTQINYTVTVTEEEDDDGNVTVRYNLQVESAILRANARPGSIGAALTGYTVDYYYGDGTPVPFPLNARFAGSLNMRVLPGLICDDLFTGEEVFRDCSVNSPGASFQTGPIALSSSFVPLDPDTGYTMFFAQRSIEGSYAIITLTGVDALNRPFSKVLSPITIIQSVVAG